MKNKNTKSGFTLIELLVVIFLVGLIASVSQVKMVASFDKNLMLRAANMTFTVMKLAKHMALMQRKDYIFCMDNLPSGQTPYNDSWSYSRIRLYRHKNMSGADFQDYYSPANTPDPGNFGQFEDGTFLTSDLYYEKFSEYALPEGTCIAPANSTDKDIAYVKLRTKGTGISTDPYRVIFKYYGTARNYHETASETEENTITLGKFPITVKRFLDMGITQTSANLQYYYTIFPAGRETMGSPILVLKGFDFP